jgi:competence protein ComEC
VRTSGAGKVVVLFPEEAIPRMKAFGRGSEVLVDGRFVADGDLFIASGVFIIRDAGPVNRLRTAARLACVAAYAPYEWGGLALALLIGIRDNLDSELAAQYRRAGISYILALSGMHLALISAVLALLLRRPFGLKPAAVIGSVLIIGYIYIVGALPSLERAGLMYIAGAFAIVCGLPRSAFSTLCLAFLLQIAFRPASGMSLSFILSYSALGGLIIFSIPLRNIMRGYLPPLFGNPLSASIAAFLATISITASFFGEIRLIGIIIGLIVMPLTTIFMIIAMFFPLLRLFPTAGHTADLALSALYNLISHIVATGGAVPPIIIKTPLPAIAANLALLAALYLAHRLVMRHRRYRGGEEGVWGMGYGVWKKNEDEEFSTAKRNRSFRVSGKRRPPTAFIEHR